MTTPTSTRRALAALVLTTAGLATSLGLGAAPAGAVVPAYCTGSDAREYICVAYSAFVDRLPGESEVEYWAPLLPAKKSLFVATLGRSLESRYLIVEASYWDYADRSAGEPEIAYWAGEYLKPDGPRRLQAALYDEVDTTTQNLVDWAFYGVVGREPTVGELEYWGGVAEAKGNGKMADLLAGTLEVRRTRVRFAYWNELGYFPDTASRDYWAERLKTGTSFLDLRIALDASAYPDEFGYCPSYDPPARDECVAD